MVLGEDGWSQNLSRGNADFCLHVRLRMYLAFVILPSVVGYPRSQLDCPQNERIYFICLSQYLHRLTARNYGASSYFIPSIFRFAKQR